MVKVKIFTTIGNYTAIEVCADEAVELLRKLQSALGKGGEDVEDSIRIIQHFDTFFNTMQKKFKDFLTPKKSISELLKGNVLVDKIKLMKKDNKRIVVIIFDKSISKELLKNTLMSLNYEVEEVD